MSAEPALDPASILRVLRSDYGLELETLAFIADGTAPAYRAEGQGGRFFVKMLPGTAYGAELRERLALEAPLLRALRQLGVLPRVPRSHPTHAGADFAQVEDHSLILYEWIEGTNLGSGWTGALDELAPLLGRLHAGTEGITRMVPGLPAPPRGLRPPLRGGLAARLADSAFRPA